MTHGQMRTALEARGWVRNSIGRWKHARTGRRTFELREAAFICGLIKQPVAKTKVFPIGGTPSKAIGQWYTNRPLRSL